LINFLLFLQINNMQYNTRLMKINTIVCSSEVAAADYVNTHSSNRHPAPLQKIEIQSLGDRKLLTLPHESLIACITTKKDPLSIDPGGFKALRDVALFSVSNTGKVNSVAGEYLLYKFQNNRLKNSNSGERNQEVLQEAAYMDLFRNRQEVLQIVAKASYINSKGMEKVVLIVPKHSYSLRQALKDPDISFSRDLFAKSLLEGVALLHKTNMSHGDLKPGNLLLTREGKCVIADFGTATFKWDETFKGTPQYYSPEQAKAIQDYRKWAADPNTTSRPPEIQQGLEQIGSTTRDLFALGMVLYAMKRDEDGLPENILPHKKSPEEKISGRANLLTLPRTDPLYAFFHEPPKEILSYKDLVQGLLQANPEKRLTAKQALNARLFPLSCKEVGK